jgi:hypothetical protein
MIKVRVGTVSYEVTFDADAWLKIEHKTQTKGYHGFTNHHEAVIYINPDDVPDVQRQTVLHEVMHATCYVILGAPEFDHLGKNRNDREENIVRMLEGPLLMVLRDNPDLAAYLLT